jgi:hypothetical protein
MLTQILTLNRTKQRDMNPYPVFVLLPLFTTNILTKFVVIFVLHEGRRTKFRVSLFCQGRIRVSIHKQQHMGRHVEQPPVTLSSAEAYMKFLVREK